MEGKSLEDRVRGVIVGLAAGDRIGGPIRMALELAESLLERKRFDREDIFRRYTTWWGHGGFDTGPVAQRVFALTESGISREDAVWRVHEELGGLTAGCNPAHRSAPLAMASFLSDSELSILAAEEAALTHYDPLAGDVAAATVTVYRLLIKGMDWQAVLGEAVRGRHEKTRAAFTNTSVSELERGGFAPDVLKAALFFVSVHDGFGAALEAALEFAGPGNYCPVLVGTMAGARWGAENIPAAMVKHCEIMPRVQSVAAALAESWQSCQ